jgi:hypothetical protein
MRPLYEIAVDLQLIMTEANMEAAENEGEISEILSRKLEKLDGEKDVKIGNICRFYKSLNAEADMIKQEESKLAARRMSIGKRAESLKNYLSGFVVKGEKFSDQNSKISWRSSESVMVENVDLIPEDYVKVTVSADKTMLKKAIKNGDIFEGVSIVTKQNLQVK